MLNFFPEDIEFKVPQSVKTKKWLKTVSESEGYKINSINYIFCSDEFLLDINKEYLDHNYYTDIITFDNSEGEKSLEGDIFISVDRVRENAETFHVDFQTELRRVLVHGLLHLIGYDDREDAEKQQMREKENHYLNLFS